MALSDSDVCPTEDAVRAFLEHLVDPMLPAKSSIRDDPPPSQQHKVAKQMHSAVLLYNYYHRKQHPELAFVTFNEFCKLAVVLRPTLLAHMKFMQKPDETELVDVEEQLSLTEKMIMNACNICTCLDASKNVLNIEGWPISKVAVLLVDSKKENCFLLFSSITGGVWSVVEKDVDISSQSSEVASGSIHTYKKKRVIKKPTKNELNVAEDGFLQVGYSAVKEAAGVSKVDIMLLESYTVYSQSREKTASRFYIMKCSQLVNQGFIQVPIKDLIESLRGPLVKRSSSSWTVTPAVEYFHVLPYSEIISEWVSRETFSNSLQDSKLYIGLDNKPSREKEKNGCFTTTVFVKEAQDMDMDNSNIANALQVSEDQGTENPSVQHCSNGSIGHIKAEEECALIANNSNTDLEKVRNLLASKGKILSQTALNALIRKRNALALQQRMIEDEIAVCDKKIQIMLTGEEDDLELKIESIIEGCNDTWVRNQGRMCQHLEDQCLPPFIKRKRLTEAVLSMQSPCQELDGICHGNNWILPTYRLFQSDGGFQANVTVKGVDFECSSGGNPCSHPREARESAAAQMLTNLRSMAKSDQ